MATPLEDVGKQVGRSRPLPSALKGLFWGLTSPVIPCPYPLQVWRGALLLAEYILFRRDLFQGRTVLELGAGTGLTSIIAATVARTVYCTGNALTSQADGARLFTKRILKKGREGPWRWDLGCFDVAVLSTGPLCPALFSQGCQGDPAAPSRGRTPAHTPSGE